MSSQITTSFVEQYSSNVAMLSQQMGSKLRGSVDVETVRGKLNTKSGVSLISDNILVMRLLAPTGYELRKMLVPIINEITDKNLPKTWRL